MNTCKKTTLLSWFFQITAAAILAQTLFFKFSGAEESKYIFSTLGVEPWGRILAGCVELVAVSLLLHPRTAVFGALLSAGVMTGALGSHLTKLGIVVKDDGGLLFVLAVVVLMASAVVLFLRRHQLPILGSYFASALQSKCTAGECRH